MGGFLMTMTTTAAGLDTHHRSRIADDCIAFLRPTHHATLHIKNLFGIPAMIKQKSCSPQTPRTDFANNDQFLISGEFFVAVFKLAQWNMNELRHIKSQCCYFMPLSDVHQCGAMPYMDLCGSGAYFPDSHYLAHDSFFKKIRRSSFVFLKRKNRWK